MAITNATLAAAMAAGDKVAVLSASTGVVAGAKIVIDGEELLVAVGYTTATNGVNVPVIRGQGGTYAFAHPLGAKVRIALASDTEWGTPGPQTITSYPTIRARLRDSITTTPTTLTQSTPGTDHVVFLNGTSVIALTVGVPSTAKDTDLLWIASNGVAAHTVTFTGGLSGGGAALDVITINAAAPVVLGPFMAVNGLWQCCVAVPMAGTVTNITATVA